MSLKLYFLAEDYYNGQSHEDLWWTDGTTTEAVGGGADGGVSGVSNEGLGPEYLAAFGQQMIFAGADALDDGASNGLWLTNDGSNTATEVGGVNPGSPHASNIANANPNGLNPTNFVVFGSKALFFGLDTTDFPGLWSTDGTVGNTLELGGTGNGLVTGRGTNWDPINFTAFGDEVIFDAYDSSNGGASYIGLWVTDGTTAGTQEIGGPFNQAIGDSNSSSFEAINGVALGDSVLFNAQNRESDDTLWISDGTAPGTTEIGGKNNAGVVGANNTGLGDGLANAVRFGDRIFFSGEDAADEQGLWVTDGTASGTQEVGGLGDASLAAGQKPSSLGLTPTQLAVNGQQVLFNGQDALGFQELWVSDGTGSGTYEIGGDSPTGLLPNEGANGVDPHSIVSLGNGLAVFIGDDDVDGAGTSKATLWVTNGTALGTQEIGGENNQSVSGINTTGFDFTSAIIGGDGVAYFIGEDTDGNSVLWETDGTVGGTKVVPAPAGLAPSTGLLPSDPNHWALTAPPASADTFSGGGLNLNLNAVPGENLELTDTENVWDTVTGSNGSINLSTAQAFIIGGGVLITLTSLGNSMSLSQTNGNRDSVYGTKGAITLNDAQANVFGGKDNITFATGTTGNVVYLFDTQGKWDNVNGSNGAVHLTSAQANVTGNNDTIFFNGGTDDAVALFGVGEKVIGSGGDISGFEAGDTIDLAAATYAAGEHLVYQSTSGGEQTWALESASANVLADVELTGNYVAADFTFRQDAGTGTLIGFSPVDARKNDYVGNGVSDIIWQNDSSGATYEWLMGGDQKTGSVSLGNLAGWSDVGSGDFDGDGVDGVIFKNQSSGAVYEWSFVNGQHAGNDVYLGNLAGWTEAGTGSFDGPGTAGVMWQSQATGAVYEWSIVDGKHEGSDVYLGTLSGWTEAGSGDFTGDGTSDLLWQNTSTGDLWEWQMADGQHVASVHLANVAGYTMVGAGDFNGDGITDLLWKSNTTGVVWEWQMNSAGQNGSSIELGNLSGYNVASIGDFNGTGVDGIVWQSASTGDTWLWTMSNGQHTGNTHLGVLSGWQGH